jgi:hypothetical protein
MKSILLKLTLATAALGLWAATPSAGYAQTRQQLFIRGSQMGMWNRVSIFSMPQFRLSIDARGANFGFSQQVLFGPSFRGSFSPFAQFSVFQSASAQSLVFTPATGPVLRINTPAIMAFRFTPSGGVQQFNTPSISILSNLNGSVAALNTATPQFLTGNFNFTIPFNGMFAVAVPGSSLSMNGAVPGTGMISPMMMSNSMMNTMAMNTGMTRLQTAALMVGGLNMAQTPMFSIAQGLAMGLTLDQVMASPLAASSGSTSATGSRTANPMRLTSQGALVNGTRAVPPAAAVQAAAMYNGYVPPSLVMQ